MPDYQWWSDELCLYLTKHGKIHKDKVNPGIRRYAEDCGLIRTSGNGWYVLTDYGRDNALHLMSDREMVEFFSDCEEDDE